MLNFPEPQWSAPCVIETECVDSLCYLKDPYMLTGFFTQWVRAMFKNSEMLRSDKLRGYLWDEDPKVSRISIFPSYHNDTETERRRPAVYVSRGSVQISPVGMKGGMATLSADPDGNFRGRKLSNVISGSHVFDCLGDSEAESENIGIEIMMNLMMYREAVKRQAGLGALEVTSLTPVQLEGSARDYWKCGVGVAWHYVFNWTLDRDAPILKHIGLSPTI